MRYVSHAWRTFIDQHLANLRGDINDSFYGQHLTQADEQLLISIPIHIHLNLLHVFDAMYALIFKQHDRAVAAITKGREHFAGAQGVLYGAFQQLLEAVIFSDVADRTADQNRLVQDAETTWNTLGVQNPASESPKSVRVNM